MNKVRAMVVGVSRYSVDGWNQTGPARNASLIATTLLSMGLPVDRLHLFTTPEDMDLSHATTLAARGIVPAETDWASIDDFWRGELHQLAAPGDQLLVFWSGHGVTDDRDQRIFLCSDYTRSINNRVFDASGFKHALTSSPWNKFSEQLIFADACGNYPTFPTAPAGSAPPVRRGGTRQLAVWAVPDGEYAKQVGGFGAFSDVVAKMLLATGLAPWPSQQVVIDEIAKRTAAWTHSSTWIRHDGTHAKFAAFAGQPNPVSSLIGLLGGMDLAEIAPSAYERTARFLQLKPATLVTIPEMIDVLSDLDDGWNSNVSFGLTLFLKRIANHPSIPAYEASCIIQWLASNALISVRGQVDNELASERRTALLLIDVDLEPSGNMRCLTAHLRYPDLNPVPGFGERIAKIKDLSGFAAELCKLLIAAEEINGPEIQVHLLLDPPSFGLPFQQIELPNGAMLGEEHICVIHCRRRARMADRGVLKDWSKWARAIVDPIGVDQLRALPGPGHPLHAQDGIYYFADQISSSPHIWRQISRLLRFGAPYFCWPVADSNEMPSFPNALHSLILENAADVPSRVRRERLRGCTNARKIAILWDDADFRPFAFQQLGTIV